MTYVLPAGADDHPTNAVATLFIAHWDKTLDRDLARRVLRGDDVPPLHELAGGTVDAPDVTAPAPVATPHPVPGAIAVPVGAST